MTNTLRIGVLGCSSIARRRTLPAMRTVPKAVLSAVASRSIEKAKQFATEFDTVATSYEGLIDGDDVDAVYISLPNGLHHEWAARALRAGKHVLCEKPLTTTAAEAERLAAIATEHNLVLRENFTFLHHPQHARVRELLDAGRIGSPRTFAAAFCIPPLPAGDIRHDGGLGGGALLDVGVYPLRATQLLFGSDLRVVGATLRVDETLGVDLAGQVLLVTADGVFANLEFGFQHSYRSRYSLWGSSAGLSVDRAFTPPASWQPTLRIEEQNHTEELVLAPADQFGLSVGSFTDAALAGRDAAVESAWLSSSVANARLVDEIVRTAVHVPTSDSVGQ